MMQPSAPQSVKDRIFAHVLEDLEPSWPLVHKKVALASIMGGLMSLILCGQFGFAFTPMARTFSHSIHQHMSPLTCAMICGSLYAVFPVASLRFVLCPPLQFKAIMKRYKRAVALWFLGFGTLVAVLGHHGGDATTLAAWLLGAYIAAYLAAHFFYVIVPAWDWQFRIRKLDQQ